MQHGLTTICIMRIHYDLQLWHSKTYSWPTRAKVQKLLRKSYAINITLSAIDNQYQKLKAVAFMIGHKQPRQKEDGTWYMLSTNWQFTFNGLKFIKKVTGHIAHYLWTWATKALGINNKPETPAGPYPRFKHTPPPRRDDSPFLEPPPKK